MKRSLLALALLAGSLGAARAQPAVTLYGRIDASLMHNNPFGGASQFSVDSGTTSRSRWGLISSEDLGGGLKLNFNLEQGFAVDTGAVGVAGQMFSRQSWIGLSGNFGEVRVGKAWSAYEDVGGANNAAFDSAFSVENNFFGSTAYIANPPNTLRYSTPTLGGLRGSVSYSLDEAKNTDLAVAAFSAQYASGPLNIVAGFQIEGQGATDLSYTRLSGAYDFGGFVLKGLYGHVKMHVADAKTDEYSFGIDVPVSSALTVSGGVGYSKDSAAAGGAKRQGFTAAAFYVIGKRTGLYVGLTEWDGKAAGIKVGGNTKYGVGMRQSF